MNYKSLRTVGRATGATIAYAGAFASTILLGAESPDFIVPLSVAGLGTILYIANQEREQGPLESRLKKD